MHCGCGSYAVNRGAVKTQRGFSFRGGKRGNRGRGITKQFDTRSQTPDDDQQNASTNNSEICLDDNMDFTEDGFTDYTTFKKDTSGQTAMGQDLFEQRNGISIDYIGRRQYDSVVPDLIIREDEFSEQPTFDSGFLGQTSPDESVSELQGIESELGFSERVANVTNDENGMRDIDLDRATSLKVTTHPYTQSVKRRVKMTMTAPWEKLVRKPERVVRMRNSFVVNKSQKHDSGTWEKQKTPKVSNVTPNTKEQSEMKVMLNSSSYSEITQKLHKDAGRGERVVKVTKFPRHSDEENEGINNRKSSSTGEIAKQSLLEPERKVTMKYLRASNYSEMPKKISERTVKMNSLSTTSAKILTQTERNVKTKASSRIISKKKPEDNRKSDTDSTKSKKTERKGSKQSRSEKSSHKPGRKRHSSRESSENSSQRFDPGTQLSRLLSWFLRHSAEHHGLQLKSGGYLFVKDVLRVPCFRGYTLCDIIDTVTKDEKNRFKLVLEYGTWRVRANSGHSMEVPGWLPKSCDKPRLSNRGRTEKQDRRERLSRTLVKILRHTADRNGLSLMTGGYLYVDDLLRLKELKDYTIEDIRKVVNLDNKDRFTLSPDEETLAWKIKANRGHSLQFTQESPAPLCQIDVNISKNKSEKETKSNSEKKPLCKTEVTPDCQEPMEVGLAKVKVEEKPADLSQTRDFLKTDFFSESQNHVCSKKTDDLMNLEDSSLDDYLDLGDGTVEELLEIEDPFKWDDKHETKNSESINMECLLQKAVEKLNRPTHSEGSCSKAQVKTEEAVTLN